MEVMLFSWCNIFTAIFSGSSASKKARAISPQIDPFLINYDDSTAIGVHKKQVVRMGCSPSKEKEKEKENENENEKEKEKEELPSRSKMMDNERATGYTSNDRKHSNADRSTNEGHFDKHASGSPVEEQMRVISDYAGGYKGHLAVEVGEILTLEGPKQGKELVQVRKMNGQTGYVPTVHLVPNTIFPEHMECYYDVSHEETMEMLHKQDMEIGTYLVRPRKSKTDVFLYALSVLTSSNESMLPTVKHYAFRYDTEAKNFTLLEYTFTSASVLFIIECLSIITH